MNRSFWLSSRRRWSSQVPPLSDRRAFFSPLPCPSPHTHPFSGRVLECALYGHRPLALPAILASLRYRAFAFLPRSVAFFSLLANALPLFMVQDPLAVFFEFFFTFAVLPLLPARCVLCVFFFGTISNTGPVPLPSIALPEVPRPPFFCLRPYFDVPLTNELSVDYFINLTLTSLPVVPDRRCSFCSVIFFF